ncbi:tryptophan-rich sensory protein [Candidatus Daviesbacteria bacterium]|nr:tryptophan-rich sensory protein [Candidatus Daviesbacteria bacterium]
MKIKNLSKLLLYIFICEGAGIIGSFFTVSAIPVWYAALSKPAFAPPNSIFGPVWITLYILMGLSAYLIWSAGKKASQNALQLFWIHLFFNATWSISFFGLRNLGLGLVNILILWFLILAVLVKFWKINQTAVY